MNMHLTQMFCYSFCINPNDTAIMNIVSVDVVEYRSVRLRLHYENY